jgi:hypothetical protein
VSCPERERLWEEYNEALALFTACAEELEKPFTATTFSTLLISVRAAKDRCKLAREAWETHLRAHGCDGPAEP